MRFAIVAWLSMWLCLAPSASPLLAQSIAAEADLDRALAQRARQVDEARQSVVALLRRPEAVSAAGKACLSTGAVELALSIVDRQDLLSLGSRARVAAAQTPGSRGQGRTAGGIALVAGALLVLLIVVAIVQLAKVDSEQFISPV